MDRARSSTRWLAGRWLSRRRAAMVPILVLTAVGSTAAMVSIAAGERTASAYDAYLGRADVADVVINPGLHTREIDAAIRSLPGVERVTTDYLFTVTLDDGAPRTRFELDMPVQLSSYAMAAGERPGTWDYAEEVPDDLAAMITFSGSPDGGHVDVGRPVILSGRLPSGRSEVVLNVAAAASTHLDVGDVVPLAFWEGTFLESAVEGDYEAYLTEEVAPLGTEQATVVGIVTMPDEVLPDGLYPRERAILSADLAGRYRCPPIDVALAAATTEQVLDAIVEVPCSSSYSYHWLSMAGGAEGVAPALSEFVQRAGALSPPAGGGDPAAPAILRYQLLSTETEQRADQVRRSIQPTVAALVVLGVSSAVVTAALIVLLASREVRATEADQRQWHQIGVDGRGRRLVSVAPLVTAIGAGALVAVAAGWALDVGPAGVVAVVEPESARRLSMVGVLAVVAIVVAGAAGTALVAGRTARRIASVGSTVAVSAPRGPAWTFGSPAAAHGVRAAYGQRTSIPVVGGLALLVATLVATSVFANSLSTLVDTPRSYGWPWDLGAVHGFGYGGVDLESMARALDDDPDVEAWTALGFRTGITVDGRPSPAIIGYDRSTDVDVALVAGRLPAAADEVALGQTLAQQGRLAVGDAVELGSTESSPWTATVTGIVVLPTLGQYLAEPTRPGSGVLLPEAVLSPEEAAWAVSFIGVDLRPGTDDADRTRVLHQISATDPNGVDVSLAYPGAVRPPAIVDARSTLAAPVAVSLGFAVVATGAMAAIAWSSIRTRRRELAILRTFGFSSVQVRTSIRVQSVATMLAALAVAVPLGVIAGRSLWRAFAGQLGVLPEPAGAWTLVGIVVLGGLVVSALAAEVPARAAARALPADGLRVE